MATDKLTGAEAHDSDDEGTGLIELCVILWSRKLLLVLVPLAIGIAALGVAFLMTPIFSARTTFLPPQQQQSAAAAALSSLGSLAGLAGAGSVKSPADQYVSLMQSVTVSDRIIDRFDLLGVYKSKWRANAHKALASNVSIQLGKRDGLITVTVDDVEPKRAADMANAYVQELMTLTSSLALTEAQQRRVFFEKQLAATKNRLADAQRLLEASGFNEGALRAEPRAAAESYARLRAEATAAEINLQTMRGYLNENAPEFKQTQSTLAALRSQLLKIESTSSPSGANGSDYVGKYREFKYQETLFELFSKQYELARIDESREGALIQVIDVAKPPELKSKPSRLMIAVGATLASAVLLVVFVLCKHFWRMSMREPHTAERLRQVRAALAQD
jgi:uncharacterized protein involved in exopolysaccharide biosynthesis